MFERMNLFQKIPNECNHFSRKKKRFVYTSLLTGALGAFRKCTVRRTHLVRQKETKQEVSSKIDARKSLLGSEVREHAGLVLEEEFSKYKKFVASRSSG